jgi:DNA-binding beta-propeller fold protein YncE
MVIASEGSGGTVPGTYLDFDLLIEHAAPGYRAKVLDSPTGQSAADFSLPFSSQDMEIFLLRLTRSLSEARRRVRRLESQERELVKGFGGQLFKAVFSGAVLGTLQSSLNEAFRKDAGLRIRLRLTDTPELAEVPWEFLFNSTSNRFLNLNPDTPLIRYLDLPMPVRPLTVTPPLRVLVMISSPTDFPQLDVGAEWDRLNAALGDLAKRGLVTITRLPNASLAGLQRPLRLDKYHIFHFIGHGGFDEQAQDGALALEDAQGRARLVSGQDLGVMLSNHRSLRLIVLNACEGARASSSDPFAGVAQSLVQQGIPAVIAMQFEITDEAAITFAQELYAAIADGYSVDAALGEARRAIFASGNDVEWATPVLYTRSHNGQLFRVTKLSEVERVAKEEGERDESEHLASPEPLSPLKAEVPAAAPPVEGAPPAPRVRPQPPEPVRLRWFRRVPQRKALVRVALVVLSVLAVGIAVGVLTQFGGGGRNAGPAGLQSPEGMALAPDGAVYVADTGNNRVVAIGPTGKVTVVAGNGIAGSSGDGGQAHLAQLSGPQAVAVAPDGTIDIADNGNGVIRRVTKGIIETVHPEPGGDTPLYDVSALAVDRNRLLIATEARVYAIGSNGALEPVAGTGTKGYSGDGGKATDARVNGVEGLAIDPKDGSIYIADSGNNLIRKIAPDGTITKVAGNGTYDYTGDNQPAVDVGLNTPTAVALDAEGNIYIAAGNAVRRVSTDGIIGTAIPENEAGFGGDGGPARLARFDGIQQIVIDENGNLYLLDRGNNRIRKVSRRSVETIG